METISKILVVKFFTWICETRSPINLFAFTHREEWVVALVFSQLTMMHTVDSTLTTTWKTKLLSQ